MYNRYLKLLELKGCKTADVCRGTGLDPATFSHWKKEQYTPKVDTLEKLADFFDVPVTYFYEREFETPSYLNELMTNYVAQALRDDQKELMKSASDLTEEQVQAVELFIKALKGEAKSGY